jgi:hypothetical protein
MCMRTMQFTMHTNKFDYYRINARDDTLAMLARLFTELELDSFTIAGPNNQWTVTAREG